MLCLESQLYSYYKYYYLLSCSCSWRQDRSLVAWWTRESGGSAWLSPAAAEIFPCCTHNAVTQTVQIRGIIIATERITYSRRLKKCTQKKK